MSTTIATEPVFSNENAGTRQFSTTNGEGEIAAPKLDSAAAAGDAAATKSIKAGIEISLAITAHSLST